jgi:thiamine biosynthesis lipoprotein
LASEAIAAAETLRRGDDHWAGAFRAMASPCEVLVESDDRQIARRVLAIVADEARRIEAKFSRYRSNSVVSRINRCEGDVEVDDETARLLDYSGRLFELSGGKFDVTSGVLRKAWRFDGGDRVPDRRAVQELQRHVGWPRVRWRSGKVALQPGMEIDFGGIAKEYAVDSAALLVAKAFPAVSCLVNFGGDLAVSVPRQEGESWRVGIEEAGSVSGAAATRGVVRLVRGGLATSGDARRFLIKDGVRYSHILDPVTGWPVRDAPRSVTVAARTCTDAGMLATLAMLQGKRAERFLRAQGVDHWVQR